MSETYKAVYRNLSKNIYLKEILDKQLHNLIYVAPEERTNRIMKYLENIKYILEKNNEYKQEYNETYNVLRNFLSNSGIRK